MASIKSVVRSASVAFAPTLPDVIATGTMAGAIDLAFSTSASLDILKLDFSAMDQDLPMLSSFPTNDRFNRLSWGTAGVATAESPFGLIAGGLADGSINIWDPAPLIRNAGTDLDKSLLARLQKHTGPVRGLEFNVQTPNYLASGGEDGELCIWDLNVPTAPNLFPPLKGGGSGGQGEIAYLSWNRKVGHILASTSYGGASVVWDLKRQKQVISLTDPTSRRRCSVLQWNPDVATQLIVASDDDRSPSLQVWDLRNSVSPIKELFGHTKGVLAMAWSPVDSAFLLTCAKDNRTLCWDTVSGEIMCELPFGSNWNFDVQWSPRVPGILSTSSFDGRISIYNIEACSRMLPSEGVFGGALSAGTTQALRAPKWLKRPVGVCFGFGGKLVSFFPKKTASGATASTSEISVNTLVTEEDLVMRSKDFEAAIVDSGKSSLQTFCEMKAQRYGSEEEKEIWSFLKVMFDDNARRSLLCHLGFAVQQSQCDNLHEVQDNYVDYKREVFEKLRIDDGAVENNADDSDFPSARLLSVHGNTTDDGTDFFNNLDTPKGSISPQLVSTQVKESVDSSAVWEIEHEGDVDEDDPDRAIQHALVVGDFKGAVEHCLLADRLADALVLAHAGGSELWSKTLNECLRRNCHPYQKVMAAVVSHDIKSLVDSRPLKSWKETLALLCSYAQPEDWSLLCGTLAARLDGAGNIQVATLCYICAGNIEKTVELCSRDLCVDSCGLIILQDLMEKTVILALATGEKHVTPELSRFVCSYAELLASQGLLTTAMEYLNLVPDEHETLDLSMLRDRVHRNLQDYTKAHISSAPLEAQDFQVAGSASSVTTNAPTYTPSYYQESAPQVDISASYIGTSTSSFAVYPPITPQQQNLYPGSSTPYNPTSGTQTFYQSAVVQAPQPSFSPSSVGQPQVTSFVPTNPPPIPNLGQYQQPPNPQFYQGAIGAANLLHQNIYAAPPAAQMPNLMLPSPAIPPVTSAAMSQGFTPVSSPMPPPLAPQQQQSVMSPAMQPQSPSANSGAVPLQSTAAPVPTIQNVNTSNVTAEFKPVIGTLMKLYNETSEALGGARANPAKKREIDDNSKKLGALFAKLNSGDISANAASKLIQLCQHLDTEDYSTALYIQVGLTTSDWDECSFWLGALKRMIKTRQSFR